MDSWIDWDTRKFKYLEEAQWIKMIFSIKQPYVSVVI
jgi:hypothetical protein